MINWFGVADRFSGHIYRWLVAVFFVLRCTSTHFESEEYSLLPPLLVIDVNSQQRKWEGRKTLKYVTCLIVVALFWQVCVCVCGQCSTVHDECVQSRTSVKKSNRIWLLSRTRQTFEIIMCHQRNHRQCVDDNRWPLRVVAFRAKDDDSLRWFFNGKVIPILLQRSIVHRRPPTNKKSQLISFYSGLLLPCFTGCIIGTVLVLTSFFLPSLFLC